MRILHVIPSLDPRVGGLPAALAGLAAAQAAAGLRVTVLATCLRKERTDGAERLRNRGVTVESVGPTVGPLRWYPRLREAVEGMVETADAVHVHGLWYEIQHQAAVAARRRGVPYFICPHGMLDPWSLSQSRRRKQLYLRWRQRRDLDTATAIHFTTQAECDLTGPLGLRAPAIIAPNGLDLEEFASLPPPGTFRKRYPVLEDRPVVLFLGRLHPKKGLELLVRAFARTRRGDAVLVIAGPDEGGTPHSGGTPPFAAKAAANGGAPYPTMQKRHRAGAPIRVGGYAARVRAAVEAHGLTDRVLFTGPLYGAERIAAMADAALFVLPSHQENFGIAVVEALAAGTPVIVSDQVNIQDAIAGAGVGGVVPLDADAWAGELERWLGDAELRRAASQGARAFVWERYDWRQIAARWIDHYQADGRLTRETSSCISSASTLTTAARPRA